MKRLLLLAVLLGGCRDNTPPKPCCTWMIYCNGDTLLVTGDYIQTAVFQRKVQVRRGFTTVFSCTGDYWFREVQP